MTGDLIDWSLTQPQAGSGGDRCPACRHDWHGQRCQPYPNAPASLCACPTSYEQEHQ